eukprot:UN06998
MFFCCCTDQRRICSLLFGKADTPQNRRLRRAFGIQCMSIE